MQLRPSRVPHSGRGFTLIELLVVISIIAILAGLALPALQGALNAAKKAQANAMISQLKVALTAFNTEYGTWPLSAVNDTDLKGQNATLYHVLIGDTTGATTANGNTRQIVFMEFANKDLDNPTSASPTFVDPWYRTTQDASQTYTILVDANFDNQISVPNTTTSSGNTTINASVAVWDYGPPLTGKTLNTSDQTKYLHSW